MRQRRVVQRLAGVTFRNLDAGLVMRIDDTGSGPPLVEHAEQILQHLMMLAWIRPRLLVLSEHITAVRELVDEDEAFSQLLSLPEENEILFDREGFSKWLEDVNSTENFEVYFDTVDQSVSLACMKANRFRATRDQRAPIVFGRKSEQERMLEILDGLQADRPGGTLALVGPAGFGKSTMAQACAQYAQDHEIFLLGFRQEEGRTLQPLGVMAVVLRALLPQLGYGDDQQDWQEWLDLQPRFSAHRIAAALLLELRLERDEKLVLGQRTQDELISLCQKTLIELTIECTHLGPVCVVAEDVHWAGSVIRNLLRAFAELAQHHALLCLFTTRPEQDPFSEPSWPMVERFELGPLSTSESVALAKTYAAQHRTPWQVQSNEYLSDEVVANCAARSGGHPLFLVQLIHAAIHHKKTDAESNLSTIFAQRYQALSEPTRLALGYFACIGERAPASRLQRITPTIIEDLAEAVDANLVEVSSSEWRFHHALIREAVLNLQSQDTRAMLHERIARSYGAATIERAEHFAAAGTVDAGLAFYEIAQRRRQESRISESLSLIRRGLSVPSTSSIKLHLLMLQGELLRSQGDAAGSRQAYDEAEAYVEEDNLELRVQIELGHLAALRLLGQIPELQERITRLEQSSVCAPWPQHQASLSYFRGCAHFAKGELGDCRRSHERAIELALDGDHIKILADAYSGLGDALYAQGEYNDSMAAFETAIGYAQQARFARAEVGATHMAAILRTYVGQVSEGMTLARRGYQLASHVGDARSCFFATTNLGLTLYFAGDYAASREHFEEAKELGSAIGSELLLGMGAAFSAHVELAAGDRERAEYQASYALRIARSVGNAYFGGVAMGVSLLCHPDSSTWEEDFEMGYRWSADGISHNVLYFSMGALQASARHRDTARIERCIALVQKAFRSHDQIAIVRRLLQWARYLCEESRGVLRGERISALIEEARTHGDRASGDLFQRAMS